MQISIACVVIVLCILLDQVTKFIAKKKLKNKRDKYVIKKFLYFTYIENSGMAMGKFDGKYILFYIATIISCFIYSFFAFYINFNHNALFSVGLSLLVGGTLGNFFDRVFRSYVIDFITGKIRSFHLPVYNLADLFIFIGSLLAIVFAFISF